MKKFFLVLLVIILGQSCGKVENTSSTDAMNYSIPDGSSKYRDAARVLRRYCIGCHSFAGLSEADLLTTRAPNGQLYIQARSLENSYIYTKIRGNLTSTTGNMPPTGSVSANDLAKIADWILNI